MAGLLALDLATKTGWAHWAPGRAVASGVKDLGGGTNLGVFLGGFDFWLSDMLTDIEPDRIVFESPILPRKTNLATCRKLYSLAAMTELIAVRREIPVMEARLQSIRSHFIGRTRGGRDLLKRLTVEECRARGWDPVDDNAADALATLDYTAQRLRLAVDWPRTPLEAA